MTEIWANEFDEIPTTLIARPDLRQAMLTNIAKDAIPGKVTEGGDRLEKFRVILSHLIEGKLTFKDAIVAIEHELSPHLSAHGSNNQVFPERWAERLLRIQFSRFYNQTVMEDLLARGETMCFVPHSSKEKQNSKCSKLLAGQEHSLETLYKRLIESYRNGNFGPEVKIPDHPFCTHVIIKCVTDPSKPTGT
jgi:hypothetical protein